MMPGKLLSDADLESDAAMGKVEIATKNEKVPPRAEGPGARQDARPGAGRGGVRRPGALGARRGPGLSGDPRGSRPRGA